MSAVAPSCPATAVLTAEKLHSAVVHNHHQQPSVSGIHRDFPQDHAFAEVIACTWQSSDCPVTVISLTENIGICGIVIGEQITRHGKNFRIFAESGYLVIVIQCVNILCSVYRNRQLSVFHDRQVYITVIDWRVQLILIREIHIDYCLSWCDAYGIPRFFIFRAFGCIFYNFRTCIDFLRYFRPSRFVAAERNETSGCDTGGSDEQSDPSSALFHSRIQNIDKTLFDCRCSRIKMGRQIRRGNLTLLNDVQHHFSVRHPDILVHTGQNQFVTGKFHFPVAAADRKICQRIKPVQRNDRHTGQFYPEIVPAVVRKLMCKNTGKLIGGQWNIRKNNDWTYIAAKHRTVYSTGDIQPWNSIFFYSQPDTETPAQCSLLRVREKKRFFQSYRYHPVFCQTKDK